MSWMWTKAASRSQVVRPLQIPSGCGLIQEVIGTPMSNSKDEDEIDEKSA
jgi:hypothetical protein